jgi:hypothetical protein
VPMAECIFQRAIENLNANVEERLNSVPVPSHPRLLRHPLCDELLHCELSESVSRSIPIWAAIASWVRPLPASSITVWIALKARLPAPRINGSGSEAFCGAPTSLRCYFSLQSS